MLTRPLVILLCTLFATLGNLHAAYVQAELPLERLPEEHDYQKKLRQFMATLSASDFEIPQKPFTAVVTTDREDLYRMWLLSISPPNLSAATVPAARFTLAALESRKGIAIPAGPPHCHSLAWLAKWDHAANPYHNLRALKLRAFVIAATDTMMLDYLYEHDPQGADRSDFLGGNLIWLGYTYSVVRDTLPKEVAEAFAAGLKRLILRLHAWGPKGLMTDMDLFAPVGLRYISDAMDDPEVKKLAEEYSRTLFTDPHYFHPAGYFVDNGCFDTSYNGISLYFATWAALMSDWGFVHDAVDKAFRLRAHLCFPDPDGSFSGPSHTTSRCSGDPFRDQWQFPPKTYGSGMISDEALYFAPLPTEAKLNAAPKAVASAFNAQLINAKATESGTWKEVHWNGFNFAHEYYKKGDYERRLDLQKNGSPLFKPLYLRGENFVRDFAKVFLVAKYDSYAVAIHTGPVGGLDNNWHRPYGYGGGELSAFWTPATGSVMLGRRRGIQGTVYDSFDEWRLWPIHAVTGVTADGDVVSSSRIKLPQVESHSTETGAEIRVTGTMPKYVKAKTALEPTALNYERRFTVNAGGVRVATSVTLHSAEKLTELYETIPIFLREQSNQPMPAIHFQVAGKWVEGTPESHERLTAVKVNRFNGAVLVTFAHPVSAKLSPEIWKDGFQTGAHCRTLLIDLLKGKSSSAGTASVEYTISPAQRP